MPEIRPVTIKPVSLPEIRRIPPSGALPEAPAVTLELGMPVVEMPLVEVPSFKPMDYAPHEFTVIPPPRPVVPSDSEEEGSEPSIDLPAIQGLPGTGATRIKTTEEKPTEEPFIKQAIDGLPPVGAVVTTTTIALLAATAALVAKPFSDLILKLIKPTVKKTVKKVSHLRGKPVKVDSVWERRLAQRDRNRALRALRRALKP